MITINYSIKSKSEFKIHQFIMNWLFLNYGVIGNEDYLIEEPLINLICESGMIALENGLNKEFEEDVYLPRDLCFIATI